MIYAPGAVSDGWDGGAYDKAADPQHAWGTELLDLLDLPPHAVVLDAGCGSGRVTADLLDRHQDATVVAVDASPSMIEAARDRLADHRARLEFRITRLPDGLPDSPTFDAAVSTGTFHWIPDHAALFRALRGAIRPGGVLVAQCGGAGSLAAVRAAVEAQGIEIARLNRYAAPGDTASLLRDAGFAAVDCWAETRRVEFRDRDQLARYLLDAALGPYLAGLAPEDRAPAARRVAESVAEPVAEFVRLNIVATRP